MGDLPSDITKTRLKTKVRRLGGRVALAAALAVPVGVTVAQGSASADDCTNASVMHVWTEDYGLGHLRISVIPTNRARFLASRAVTNDIWHAVQQCVPGLYGVVADGVYQQIQCHVDGALVWGPAGGYSWDFETWREPVSWDVAYWESCNWGGWPYSRI
jgi:hypothetical protein